MRRTLLALAAALAAASAGAHTDIQRTAPADGAALAAAPETLVLEFNEPVRLTAVTVRGADGVAHEIDPLPGGFAARFEVAAPELAPGDYDVEWRALSQDTHVIDGAFGFTIEAGALH